MIDILFVNPPLSPKEKYGAFAEVGSNCPPLNLLNLAAMTRQHDFKTKIVDCEVLPYSFDEMVKYLIKYSPKYVGITASTLQIYAAANLSDALKKQNSAIVTIIGGNHISALPKDTMEKFPAFDIGVIGEGDITIIELLTTLENNGKLDHIEGIAFRKSDKVVFTPPRALLSNLDELPFPAWDLLENLKVYKPAAQRLTTGLSAFIITARGCPYQCNFCDRSVLGNKFRVYSIDYIKKMIQHMQSIYSFRDLTVSDLTVLDESLTVSKKRRLFDFCMLIKGLGLSWSCNSRVDLVNEIVLQALKDSGCWLVLYGIESGSDTVLKELKKGTTMEQNKKAITLTKNAGLKSSGFFMLGNPKETKETLRKTIDFACNSGLDYITPFYFIPLPGSKIYDNYEKYGVFENDWKKLNALIPLFIPYGLTKKDLLNAYKRMLIKFYLRPSFLLPQMKMLGNPFFIRRLFAGGKSLIKTIINS